MTGETEQLYTLEQAEAELAARQCRQYGHGWRVIDLRTTEDLAGTPVEVVCDRCTQHHAVVAAPTVDPAELPALPTP